MDRREAEEELRNWGRCMNDSWLEHHLLHTPPPTSEGYIAPVGDIYDPPPVRAPHDEIAAQLTTDIVVLIGMEHMDSYRVLVRWYCHIMQTPDLSHSESIKRLSKFMHTSYQGAERMLKDAVSRYVVRRLQTQRENGRVMCGSLCPQESTG